MKIKPLILSSKVFSRKNVYETYRRFHNIEDLDIVRSVINAKCPKYISAFDKVMRSHSYHSLNILIAKTALFDDYTDWLFSILFDVQKQITIADDGYQRRVFGFLSERLLDVWIQTQNVPFKEFPVSMIEQSKLRKLVENTKKQIYSNIFRLE